MWLDVLAFDLSTPENFLLAAFNETRYFNEMLLAMSEEECIHKAMTYYALEDVFALYFSDSSLGETTRAFFYKPSYTLSVIEVVSKINSDTEALWKAKSHVDPTKVALDDISIDTGSVFGKHVRYKFSPIPLAIIMRPDIHPEIAKRLLKGFVRSDKTDEEKYRCQDALKKLAGEADEG